MQCITTCLITCMLYQYFAWTHVGVFFIKKGNIVLGLSKWVWFNNCYSCQREFGICNIYIFFKSLRKMFKGYSLVSHWSLRKDSFTDVTMAFHFILPRNKLIWITFLPNISDILYDTFQSISFIFDMTGGM